MKKREISEILDSDGNLIGNDDKPQNQPNQVTADGTTDHNARIHSQHYANDFLGIFGYYNESEGNEPINLRIARVAYNYFDGDDGLGDKGWDGLSEEVKDKYLLFSSKITDLFKPKSKEDQTLTESEMASIIEDVITKRKDSSLKNKKNDNDLMSDKVVKIKSLFADLSDRDKGDLIKQLK